MAFCFLKIQRSPRGGRGRVGKWFLAVANGGDATFLLPKAAINAALLAPGKQRQQLLACSLARPPTGEREAFLGTAVS